MNARDKWVDALLGRMSSEQKVGQMMVFGFAGPVITPDIVELVTRQHVGGLRVTQRQRILTLYNDVKPGEELDDARRRSFHLPTGLNRDVAYVRPHISATPAQYAGVLNTLRQMSLERELGIPLHFTIDQEGGPVNDLSSGQRMFPHPMGLAATGEPDVAYRAAVCIGRQARAVGINMIHSPVLDVNTNPKNPEIGTRAYSDNPGEVSTYATASLRGFNETGLVATGKHFPGRGESVADAHWGLPVADLDRETLLSTHVAPYQSLMSEGLPAIMSAHTIYPALGDHELPASLSPIILAELLRKELGYEGIITTDNMMMGGILKKYEMSEAIVMAIIAGNDLILMRDESPLRLKILATVKEAVRSGRIPESRLNDSVARILGMRWDMGLAQGGGLVDPAGADTIISDPNIIAIEKEAAEKSLLLLRDEQGILPLKPDANVLLVEQVFTAQAESNNMYSHPGLLWEQMCKCSNNVGSVEIPGRPRPEDTGRIMRRLDEADVIVMTNYYYNKEAFSISGLIREIKKCGKPVVVVSNTLYEFGAPWDFETVLVCSSPGSPAHCAAAARTIYGKFTPTAKLPVKLWRGQ